MHDCEPVELGALTKEEVFDLLMNYAGGEDYSQGLKEIGEKIAEKLKGSPLAAKTIGRILRREVNTRHWRNILESEIWQLAQNEYDIIPALQLSYDYLTEHLKPCFAFCSIFPKDFIYIKSDIIQMWIALGFIQESPVRNVLLEDEGNTYVNALLNASMFQPHEGDDVVFMIHDLIHDMAKMVSKDEIFTIQGECEARQIPETVRHLGVCLDGSSWDLFKRFGSLSTLRTLIFFDGNLFEIGEELGIFLKMELPKARGLRILSLQGFPWSVGEEFRFYFDKLKCLRYLDLSQIWMEKLPDSVATLYHLQVLNLEYCGGWEKIPHGLTKLMNLRHLLGRTEYSDFNIASINLLQLLQELTIDVPPKEGDKMRNLANMKQLKELRIRNLENITSKEEAMQMGLKCMKHLRTVHLEWRESDGSRNDMGVLEGLQPHLGIESLTIDEYSGDLCVAWLEKCSLEHLQNITLQRCRGGTILPPLGKVRYLKYLSLYYMYDLRVIRGDFFGHELAESGQECGLTSIYFGRCLKLENFLPAIPPKVTKLKVEHCPKIREAVSTLGWFPATLKELKIYDCGGLRNVLETSHLERATLLKKLYLDGCNSIKSLPNKALQRLRWLTLESCSELDVTPGASNGFKDMASLYFLHINLCPKLSSTLLLRGAGLPASLEYLEIFATVDSLFEVEDSTDQFIEEPLHLPLLKEVRISGSDPKLFKGLLCCYNCPSLRDLLIRHFRGMESLDDLVVSFNSLEYLYLTNLPDLRSLPINLSELPIKGLHIESCPKVVVLAEARVPPNLKFIYITNCPELSNSLSEEWLKVPYINHDG